MLFSKKIRKKKGLKKALKRKEAFIKDQLLTGYCFYIYLFFPTFFSVLVVDINVIVEFNS